MRHCLFIVFALTGVQVASAQQGVVQQPVVGGMGLNTAVVVPDRGEVFLGEVTNSTSVRTTVGPWPHRLYWGRGLTTLAAEVDVYVQDIPELDRALLEAGEKKLGQISTADRATLAREIVKAARTAPGGQGANAKELNHRRDFWFLRQ